MYNYYPAYDLRATNENFQPVNFTNGNEVYPEAQDERFFWAPFVVGGLAGTALGYGIANNNQINNGNKPCCGGGFYPVYPTPYYSPYPNNFSSFNNNYFY